MWALSTEKHTKKFINRRDTFPFFSGIRILERPVD